MATFRESPLNRLLLALLARWTGQLPSIQDARRLREVARFAAMFGATILLPALLLAWFALASIRSEELSVDADLRARASAIDATVQQELDSVFGRFELQTRARVAGGGSPIEQIGELSPWLRLVVRLDGRGQLVAPFAAPEPDATPLAPAAFRRAWRDGVRHERQRQWAEAAEAYDRALRSTADERLVGEAAFARARVAIQTGADPNEVLSDVYADHATTRDRTGFRIGDLVLLSQAALRADGNADVAAGILQDLVNTLLNRRWVLGQASEPTVARRALQQIPASFDPDWRARAQTRLRSRTDQLRWAQQVAGEIELLGTSVKVPEGELRYIAGPDSSTLWAMGTLQRQPHLFAFDLDALLAHLAEVASRSTTADPDLTAQILVGAAPTGGVLVQRSLAPYLQFATLVVGPSDPDALATQKANRRAVRITIVVLAVFLVFVGVLASARVVSRELENARMKADFAANVSHELRSPITQIRLKAESLQLELYRDEQDQRAHYDAIVHEAERLSRLVDNVLDFAAIERGARRYQLRADDLIEIVALQTDAARGPMRERGIQLEVELPDDLPPVWVDREAIGQVLTNLLSNATKYGADGAWVGVRVEATEAGVELTIADRGIGISPEDLPRIFDDFYRSTNPLVRRRKGTGIGLAIVRYIVEAHGGTIAVESEPGEGTTFTVTLPPDPPPGSLVASDHAEHPVR